MYLITWHFNDDRLTEQYALCLMGDHLSDVKTFYTYNMNVKLTGLYFLALCEKNYCS